MPINVPQSVFDKYFDVIDSTFNIFGVTCQLVYIEKVEEISVSYDNYPTHNSISAHRRGPGVPAFRREDTVIREVEKTEDITLKVYWDNRSWIKVGKETSIKSHSGRKRLNISGAYNPHTQDILFSEDKPINQETVIECFNKIESFCFPD